MLRHNVRQIVWNSLFTPAGDRGGVYNFDATAPVSILRQGLSLTECAITSLTLMIHNRCYKIDLLSWRKRSYSDLDVSLFYCITCNKLSLSYCRIIPLSMFIDVVHMTMPLCVIYHIKWYQICEALFTGVVWRQVTLPSLHQASYRGHAIIMIVYSRRIANAM